MSGLLTRRSALRGSAMAMLGLGASVGLPATASAAPAMTMSLEAEALQAELAGLSSTYRRACREADEADEATVPVDPPEALYVRRGDVSNLRMRCPVVSWEPGRRWWADADLIEDLRAASFLFLNGDVDQIAVARRDEIVGAWDGWKAAQRAAEDASGFTVAQERFEAAFAAYAEFRTRLVEMRTGDPEVLTVKALCIAGLCRGREDVLGRAIERAVKREDGAFEDALALSLARDFLGLLGADHRGGARV